MATEKIGVYRRWLEPAPNENGEAVPQSSWPVKRRYSWSVRWFGTDGKRYSKSFSTRKEADRFARKLQEEVNSGTQDKTEKISFHEFVKEHERLIQGQVAYGTVVEQMHKLALFKNFIGGQTLLSNIKPRDAEAFICQRIASGLSPATVNKDIRTLRRIFNLAIDPRGYLKEGRNPFVKIKQRKKTLKPVNYLSIEEYHTLLKSTDDLWWKAFISTAYCCGLRRGEILNLTWNDIDFENQYIKVSPKKNGEQTIEWEPKDHECRIVPMPDEVTQLLADLQAESSSGFPYIFVNPARLMHVRDRIRQGTWNSRCEIINNMVKGFNKLCAKAGVPKSSIHDLRRSAITNWAQHLPIQLVQQFAGHSNITTTRQYYLSIQRDSMASASKVINKMFMEAKLGLTQY